MISKTAAAAIVEACLGTKYPAGEFNPSRSDRPNGRKLPCGLSSHVAMLFITTVMASFVRAESPAPPDGEAWIVMRDSSERSKNYALEQLEKAGRKRGMTCGIDSRVGSLTCGIELLYWIYTHDAGYAIHVVLFYTRPDNGSQQEDPEARERMALVLDDFAKHVRRNSVIRAVIRCTYPITHSRLGPDICDGEKLPRKSLAN